MLDVQEKAKAGKGYNGEPNIWHEHIQATRGLRAAIAHAEEEEKK
jgi:hypothetical protein